MSVVGAILASCLWAAVCGEGDFIKVVGECDLHSDQILVSLHTSEPFWGMFFSRNRMADCKVEGGGATDTRLAMDPARCGIRPGQVSAREVDVYVQHDVFLQQVIDEQFLVQCLPGRPEAVVSYLSKRPAGSNGNANSNSYTRDVTVTSKLYSKRYRNADPIVPPPPPPPQSSAPEDEDGAARLEDLEESIVSNLIDSKLDVMAETPSWVEREREREREREPERRPPLFRSASATRRLQRQDSSPGWMDISWPGDDEAGGALAAGTNVSVVIRLKHYGDHDTMLSNCLAFAGDHDNEMIQDLTDFRGCSVDTAVMANFQASFNSRTSTKVLRTSFPVFSFPAHRELHIKCSVLVCRTNCPLTKCLSGEEPDRALSEVAVIDKFVLESKVLVEEAAEGRRSRFDAFQDTRANPEPVSRLTKEEREEVEEALLEQVVLEEISAAEDPLLCLSPARIIMAFGLLLFVLLLALVFACLLWMRARAKGRNNKLAAAAAGAPGGPPPPPPHMIARPGNVPPPPPPGPPPMRRGAPYLLPRVNMPYIRVMQ